MKKMLGVQRSEDGSWAWIAPCGAAGGEHATSRDLTRESYQAHRKACKACSGAAGAPLPAKPVEKAVEVPAAKEVVDVDIAKVEKRVAKAVGKRAAKKASAEPRTGKQGTPADKAKFTKLVKAGDTLEHAWAAVRKEFPREEWGKVRDVTLACSPYRTFAAAFKDLHSARNQ